MVSSDFADKYVLWTMKPDGSGWLSASITILLYYMVEGGVSKVDSVVEKLSELALKRLNSEPERAILFQNLFDIFKTMKSNLNHKSVINLVNHQNIYATLDEGMRLILATYERENGDEYSAKKAEVPKSMNYAGACRGLFLTLGIPLNSLDLGGETDDLQSLLYFESKNPPIIIIHSKLAYINVLVRKDWADKLK